MRRREFIKSSLSGVALASSAFYSCIKKESRKPDFTGKIMTVLGPIEPGELGLALPHEHLFSQFGADPAEPPVYDEEALMNAVVPYLKAVKALGADALMDCTTAWFGRAPELLKKISLETGMRILTNTGYYGAADDRYVPPFAFKETADQLAERWTLEMRDGINGTGIRPGFIKIGVDSPGLSEIDAKLVRAAAKAHLKTGLVVEVHTGENVTGAQQQLDIFAEEGVDPSAWIWVHANKNSGATPLLQAARRGAWIELDGISKANNVHHLTLLNEFKANGLLDRVLLSHDGNSFRTTGRPPKPYDDIFKTFIPMMQKNGYLQGEIELLTVENPSRAFTIKVRRRI